MADTKKGTQGLGGSEKVKNVVAGDALGGKGKPAGKGK